MTRIFWAILYYTIAIPAVIIFQKLFQSDDSGPGINIYAFIVIIIYSCWLTYKSLRIAVLKTQESYTPFFIHVGCILVILYLIFFDQLFMLKH
jgi:tryptophan-rich sensory protein